jgi:hypothetical protein
MHGSKHVDIYLHSASRPIFEDCDALRFAPLPESYVSGPIQLRFFVSSRIDITQITADISQSQNQWDQIDDFKWLKPEPSPHFTIIPEAERIPDHIWTNIVPEAKGASLQDILNAVNVR